MLINKNEYKSSLTELWNCVFGDSYDFIELIFKAEYNDPILCFAELDGDRAVSAFYLIKNTLKFENELFDGYYLYAAATLPEYRKSGIMSRLIREAQGYCKERNVDFITLVPSEESLYGYYSRFAFESAMYRCENIEIVSDRSAGSFGILEDTDRILEIRNGFEGNTVSFHPTSFGYAYDCLKYSGFEFRSFSGDSYLLRSDDDDFSEFMSSQKNLANNILKLSEAKEKITSPFALETYNTHIYKPYGMLYPINPRLIRQWKFTDIYMNIALD